MIRADRGLHQRGSTCRLATRSPRRKVHHRSTPLLTSVCTRGRIGHTVAWSASHVANVVPRDRNTRQNSMVIAG